jgi:hypothetical protein
MATTTCKQCGYVNEGERVYCHNCGTKLDRTLLPPEEPKETPEQTRKRIRKLTRPPKRTFGQLMRSAILVLVWALVVAAVILALRSPRDVPPMPEGLMNAPAIAIALEEALAAPEPRRLVLPQDGINAYLYNTVRSKRDDSAKYSKFERVFVSLHDGAVHMTSQQSVLGYPLYASASYKLSISNGLAAENIGGNFGRLPVHPSLMKYADVIFRHVFEVLSHEKRLLGQMQQIAVGDRQITVATKSPAPSTAIR